MKEILILIGLTLLPFLELRASIPYGILVFDMHWGLVFLICIITNMILGPFLYLFLDNVMHLFLRVWVIKNIYQKVVVRTQHKIHSSVEKFGLLGVALFIGVPLPGSGSYSGALGSYLLGISFKDFVKANCLGVMIAGVAVTAIVISGSGLFGL